jgi:internalin A
MRSRAFISYSRDDKKWLDELLITLEPLVQNGLDLWCDERMQPGTKWRDELQKALDETKIAILLVTPNFLASRFIRDTELPAFIEASKQEGLVICWIPIEASNYKHSVLDNYQSVHDPAKPLAGLSRSQRKQALVEISNKILAAMAKNTPDS